MMSIPQKGSANKTPIIRKIKKLTKITKTEKIKREKGPALLNMFCCIVVYS